MKKISFLLALMIAATTFTTQTYAQLSMEQLTCVGDSNTDQQAPFILTINELQEFQLQLLIEELNASSVVSTVNFFNFFPSAIFILKLNPSLPTAQDLDLSFNSIVQKEIAHILLKFEIQNHMYAVECNQAVHGNPRAGGMN